MPRILNAEATDAGLAVSFEGVDATAHYPWFWLRDHGEEPVSLNPATLQREVDTAALPLDIRAGAVRVTDDATAVEIEWANAADHTGRYSADLLHRLRLPDAPTAPDVRLWDRARIAGEVPSFPYHAVMESDDGLLAWLEAIEAYGFGLVEGVPATPEATEQLALCVGYIRSTIFGGFWDFTANMARSDTAYSKQELGAHTDGSYSVDPPGLQMFHCLHFDGTGGESILVDGFKIAEVMRRDRPEDFATLCEVPVPARYLEQGISLAASHPVFRTDASGRVVQVVFNNYDRAPFRLPDDEMGRFYRALTGFIRLAADPEMQWRHPLRPGTALLFDNWRTLHGRAAYEGQRRLCGCYLNHEDFESRLRVLRRTAGR